MLQTADIEVQPSDNQLYRGRNRPVLHVNTVLILPPAGRHILKTDQTVMYPNNLQIRSWTNRLTMRRQHTGRGNQWAYSNESSGRGKLPRVSTKDDRY